jgi:hypothetical protein
MQQVVNANRLTAAAPRRGMDVDITAQPCSHRLFG